MIDNNRSEILNEAINLINGDRNAHYGDPLEDFQTIGTFWTTYLTRTMEARGVLDIRPHDVAVLMDLLKIARISWTPEKRDHWADLAGYAGCGWDCVVRQDA
jgi:aminoglycoside phosphotransferase (APT) family kinase protein